MYRTDFCTLWEKARVGWAERIALKHVYYIKCETNRQPRLDAWDKCSELVHWEDPEGWDGEVGGGIRMGHTCKSMHVDVWQKPIQYCKVISLQLIKINEKKKEEKVNELEDIGGETIQSETQKENKNLQF